MLYELLRLLHVLLPLFRSLAQIVQLLVKISYLVNVSLLSLLLLILEQLGAVDKLSGLTSFVLELLHEVEVAEDE